VSTFQDYMMMRRGAALVSELRIEHSKRLLEKEANETKRQTLLRRLAEQEPLLSGAPEPPERKRRA
jgi:hypothetical protein